MKVCQNIQALLAESAAGTASPEHEDVADDDASEDTRCDLTLSPPARLALSLSLPSLSL